MEPILKHVDAFIVTGITTRTKNQDEGNPVTAKIGPLWGKFFSEGISDKITDKDPESAMYGTYSNYESDASGLFDVTVGHKTTEISFDDNMRSVEIPSGSYLVFEKSGAMPQSVIDAWMDVWQFFPAHPEHERAYIADFEHYIGVDRVAVYIGIK